MGDLAFHTKLTGKGRDLVVDAGGFWSTVATLFARHCLDNSYSLSASDGRDFCVFFRVNQREVRDEYITNNSFLFQRSYF